MSLTKATYSMIAGAAINVLDYGADPSGVADSSDAIQAAVDAAGNNALIVRGVFFPKGTYRIIKSINIDISKGSQHFFSDGKSIIHVDIPLASVDTFAIVADYTVGGSVTANFLSFSMTGISVSDVTAPQNQKGGVYTKRSIGGKFTQCEFNYLLVAVDMNSDSNLNTFDTCQWRGNVVGWRSSLGTANNNQFINCQWRYHSGTAFDATGTDGNIISGGDFEPDNASPIVIANGLKVISTRVERNNSSEHFRLLNSNDIEISLSSDGGRQANPMVQVNGSNNQIKLLGGSGATFVNFANTASNNIVMPVGYIDALAPNTSLLIGGLDPSSSNIIQTFASTQSNTSGTFPEALVDTLISDDLTTWTAVNCTVTQIGNEYEMVSTGGGTPYIETTVSGTVSDLRIAFTTIPLNATGQAYVSIDGTTAVNVNNWPQATRNRCVVGMNSASRTNQVVQIYFATTGATAANRISNFRSSAKLTPN